MAYPGGAGSIMNPTVPLCVPVEGGVTHGKMILIQGTCAYGSQGMSVNLQQTYSTQEPRPNTGLHFNVRLNEGCVVRNALIGGGWGTEERQGGLPFVLGQPFELIILIENHAYKMAVNGRHFTEFRHRMSKEQCGFLRIDGNVQINFIKFQGGPKHFPFGRKKKPKKPVQAMPPHQPPIGLGFAPLLAGPMAGGASFPSPYPSPGQQPLFNPPVPLTTPIPGGLSQGKMIFLTGVPHPNCSRFTINIQQGQYPNADIALHFDARINFGGAMGVAVRNHCQGGSWGNEERHQNYFPFSTNTQFDMIILVEKQGFKVAVNNQHFVEFHHRMRPIHRFNTLSVSGDVSLSQVRFQ